MTTVILVIHLLIAIALVATVLLQRSEGGALGMGGAGGGMGGFMTGRDTANLLTRSTAILATAFMTTSMVLAIMANNARKEGSILDQPSSPPAIEEPAEAPAAPAEPEKPEEPSAPLAR